MLEFTPELIGLLRRLDRLPYHPSPRPGLTSPPERALVLLLDGITPGALRQAHTPTFDLLAQAGVSASDARTIFPTITAPAHTSLLTGARVGAHGLLYPKLLDAYGNRLVDYNEGLMRAETVAEAWRAQGLVSVGVGSRFLRGADAHFSEGVLGEDFFSITDRAIAALRDWEPNLLLVVFYIADTAGHVYGPESEETRLTLGHLDQMAARLLDAYAARGWLSSTLVVVLADHGHMPIEGVVPEELVLAAGALPHGRLALAPHALSEPDYFRLLQDDRVEDIYGREELGLLGAWGAGWGEQVISLRPGFMFPGPRALRGYHGAWTDIESRIPLILSGPGIRSGAQLGTCEIIDIAPTLSFLLGGRVPAQAEGRPLWEIIDLQAPRQADIYSGVIRSRDQLLGEFQQTKRERAAGSLSPDRFVAARDEFAVQARSIQSALHAARLSLLP